jgi:hypothetical protein
LDDLLTKKLLIRQYVVEADIYPFVKGTDFDTIWQHKVESEFGSTKVYFASIDDLIAINRPQTEPKMSTPMTIKVHH